MNGESFRKALLYTTYLTGPHIHAFEHLLLQHKHWKGYHIFQVYPSCGSRLSWFKTLTIPYHQAHTSNTSRERITWRVDNIKQAGGEQEMGQTTVLGLVSEQVRSGAFHLAIQWKRSDTRFHYEGRMRRKLIQDQLVRKRSKSTNLKESLAFRVQFN